MLILQWLSLALDNPTTSKYVDWVIISCIVLTVINAAMSFVTSMSIHKAYTEMNKRVANKVLDADYGLFVKKSCSYIITTTESMWKAVGVMSSIRSLIINMVRIVVNVIMIGIIEPTILPPIIGVTVVVGVLSFYLFRWHGKIDAKMDPSGDLEIGGLMSPSMGLVKLGASEPSNITRILSMG